MTIKQTYDVIRQSDSYSNLSASTKIAIIKAEHRQQMTNNVINKRIKFKFCSTNLCELHKMRVAKKTGPNFGFSFNKTPWTLHLKCKCRTVNHYQSKRRWTHKRFETTEHKINIQIILKSSKTANKTQHAATSTKKRNDTDVLCENYMLLALNQSTLQDQYSKPKFYDFIIARMPNPATPNNRNRASVPFRFDFISVCVVVLIL